MGIISSTDSTFAKRSAARVGPLSDCDGGGGGDGVAKVPESEVLLFRTAELSIDQEPLDLSPTFARVRVGQVSVHEGADCSLKE